MDSGSLVAICLAVLAGIGVWFAYWHGEYRGRRDD
ncbi:ABC-type transporter Mla subunit MlaD [Pararhizobium capsulatum DSM 1112]|uniref:ABC-type transporter Mla subunit MlaD n=1 Tax=Pararhizobium capsulatum DSM 1112 TaxID=1121113 RepID=A0ABU0BK87_9HYPH|nr:ABC-type transporter Mla subunit MlaD [Pararhizobium capsulatum DSM 1112]